MVQFGDILTELRQDRRLSQQELAKALGIATSSVSAYERGARLPAIDVLSRLADFFDVTSDYLLGRTKLNISPSVLSEPYTDAVTTGDLLQSLQTLSPNQRQALSMLVNDLCLVAKIKRSG